MPSSVQAIGTGLVTFFSVFLPGVLALWLAFALWLPAKSPDLASLVGNYGLKSEWWILAALLFFGYLLGSLLDIVGARVLDAYYDKILMDKINEENPGWARRFVSDEEARRYTPLKSEAHKKMRKVYGFDKDTIKQISTFSLCHSAVRAVNPQAAVEIDLILSQSKFFRATVVALVVISLLALVQLIARGALPPSMAPATFEWAMEGFELFLVLGLLPLLAYASFWRFVKLRLASTRVCYEYFVVLATHGQMEETGSNHGD